MELRQLEYFCTISELKNFTRTAEVLHVSQPSVTKAVKALESELQLTLIDRSQKQISLTEEGRFFLVHAKRIMEDVKSMKQDMLRLREPAGGTIRIGVPPTVEAYLFPKFFVKFQEANPSIQLDVQEFSDSGEIREKLGEGSLDYGILMGDGELPTEQSLLIMESDLLLCMDRAHSLAKKKEISFGDLKQEKFILQQPNTYQYQKVVEGCSAHGFVPDIVLCTSQLKTIKELCAKSMGVSVLPDFAIRSAPGLCRKPMNPALQVKVCLVWGNQGRQSPVEERFLYFMKEYIKTPEFREYYGQV